MDTTDRLIAEAAAALMKALELDNGEANIGDVEMAVGHVEDWLFEMLGDDKSRDQSLIEHEVCRLCEIDTEKE